MTFLHRALIAGHPTAASIKAHIQVSANCLYSLKHSHVPRLTLCSVGLSLYLQSRFLHTFDNQIIYVIKKIHTKNILYI